jgi:hypothetical protein
MERCWGVGPTSALLMRRDAQLDPQRPAYHAPSDPECTPDRIGSGLDQEVPNFISLIAPKSVTSPPTRLVA